MSRYSAASRRLAGLATLAYSALSLLACAHAVDDSVPDTLDSSADPTPGATSGGGSTDPGGSPSAGLGDTTSGGQTGGGQTGGQAQGGRADDGGTPGSAGQVADAGGGNSATGGSHAGGANSASSGGSSGSNPGIGGSVAAGGSTGEHVCKVTTDTNVYTPTNAGCGAYAACKGQIHWRNDEARALTKIVLSFSEPAGTTCKTDNSSSKWTITDNGATSHRCVFTASGAPWTVDSKSALSFGYDTTQTGATAPTDISIADPSCN